MAKWKQMKNDRGFNYGRSASDAYNVYNSMGECGNRSDGR